MTTAAPLKIAIIANKSWECEPLVNVLLARYARPVELSNFTRGVDPAESHTFDKTTGRQLNPVTGMPVPLPPEADELPVRGFLPIRPRIAFSVLSGAGIVEVWCIEDWMRKKRKKIAGDVTTIVDSSSSSSHEKFMFSLPLIRKSVFNGAGADLVMAFGTAGIPSYETLNGCVTIGSRVYIHNPWQDKSDKDISEQVDKYGPLLVKEIEQSIDKRIICEKLNSDFFKDMSMEVRHSAEARFLKVPINSADVPRILSGHGYASLGTINICNYDDYVWADEETLHLFEKAVQQREIGSMETTHGLIRLTWPDSLFLFISGLTDRVPMFNAEVTPRIYSQNFAAAHNAGVAVAHILPEIVKLHQNKKLYQL